MRFQIVTIFVYILVFYCPEIYSAQDGYLTIITEPSGVEVWLGNSYIGNSPVYNKMIVSGVYEIKMIDPIQKISLTEQVIIDSGKTVIIEKKIVPKYGTLKICSKPEKADVYLTVPLGKTPLKTEFVVPGKYLVQIRHSQKRYKPLEKQVIINEGESIELFDTLSEHGYKNNLTGKKMILNIGLGAGAIAGFIWAMVENGNSHLFEQQGRMDKSKSAGTRRNIGIAGGLICVTLFEVIAFF